jgi:hypothetical protein
MNGEVCIANIGPGERRRRLVFGLVAWVTAAAILAALLLLDAGRLWRLVLLGPLWAGALGFFQYREKT